MSRRDREQHALYVKHLYDAGIIGADEVANYLRGQHEHLNPYRPEPTMRPSAPARVYPDHVRDLARRCASLVKGCEVDQVVLADWCEEFGMLEEAEVLRTVPPHSTDPAGRPRRNRVLTELLGKSESHEAAKKIGTPRAPLGAQVFVDGELLFSHAEVELGVGTRETRAPAHGHVRGAFTYEARAILRGLHLEQSPARDGVTMMIGAGRSGFVLDYVRARNIVFMAYADVVEVEIEGFVGLGGIPPELREPAANGGYRIRIEADQRW